MIGIYKITSPSGRVYIGQSVNIVKRKNVYKNNSCNGQHRLMSSLEKYGFENHVFEVIEICLKSELNDRERYWQDFYNVLSKKGLNCVLVESSIKKRELSEKARVNLSKSKSGKNHPCFGKKLSETTRARISENHKKHWLGKPMLQETKDKISSSLKSNPREVTPELKKKLRESNARHWLGKKRSPEAIAKFKATVAKNGSSRAGIPVSESAKQIMREKNGNLVLDLETGVFYDSVKHVSFIYGINYHTLKPQLAGSRKNNTKFRRV